MEPETRLRTRETGKQKFRRTENAQGFHFPDQVIDTRDTPGFYFFRKIGGWWSSAGLPLPLVSKWKTLNRIHLERFELRRSRSRMLLTKQIQYTRIGAKNGNETSQQIRISTPSEVSSLRVTRNVSLVLSSMSFLIRQRVEVYKNQRK